MGYLEKLAARSRAEDVALAIGGTAAALGATKVISEGISSVAFKAKLPGLIQYAKSKHHELATVDNKSLRGWAGAVYTLSPKLTESKELFADTLYQIYQYGGNVDLASAKIMSDINRGSNKDEYLPYINAAHNITK